MSELNATDGSLPSPKFGMWARVLATIIVLVGASVCYRLGVLPIDSQSFSKTGSSPLATTAKAAVPEKAGAATFRPSEAHLQTLGIDTVAEASFRTLLSTDGKIAIDEEHTTPVFSPYAGRILRLFAKPGEDIERGKPLFSIEASDMVQGQNDFLAARANFNKAKSQLDVATVVLMRHRDLVQINAVAKRELEQAEFTQVAAQNDLKAAEVALDAARNRLRILGKTNDEISRFEAGRERISAETVVNSPISGKIVQRKVGPGQYVTGASNDPVFVIGDLSEVWLVANVRETDATKVSIDQPVEFSILAEPEKIYRTKLSYISSSVNPETRRLQVRAGVPNPEGMLRPEMFANVSLMIGNEIKSPSVPRHAVIYEGDVARVWVVKPDKSIELRKVSSGISSGNRVQVLSGLAVGENVVVRGSLFIDRLAAPAASEHE